MMAGLGDLPTTLIHLVLSFLQPREAFVCSGICRNFHTAASYFFYEEYVKENWTLPSTPTAVIDFFMSKSRQLWVAPLATFAPVPALVQNVKVLAQGYRFQVLATHRQEAMVLRNHEVRFTARFDKPVETLSAGVGLVTVLLKGGSVEVLQVQDTAVDRTTVRTEEVATHVSVYFDKAVFCTDTGKVFQWDGELHQLTFEPPIEAAITSLQCKGKLLLVLFEGGHLYKAEYPSLSGVQDPFFKKKPIGLIGSGLLHSLALQRQELPPLSHWTTPMLIDWLEANGFSDCCNVVTHSKLTGKNLEEAEDDFFLDVLGIREVERQNRLKYLRSQVLVRSVAHKCTLFGWGKNLDSQLGKTEATYHQPVQIDLPQLKKAEDVKALLCTKSYSFVLTTEGRLFALGGMRLKARTTEPLLWRDLTETLTSDQHHLVDEVFPGADDLSFLVLKRDHRNQPQKRLKGADHIMKQILWDPKLNFTDFVVGYEDRFLGIIEVSAADFSKSEIPSHRIRYFKRAGDIVWDRRSRMNLL